MEQTTSERAGFRQRIAWGRLRWAAPLAAVAAVIVNSITYVIASALGALPNDVEIPTFTGEQVLTVQPVIIASLVGVIAATIAFAIVGLLSNRPARTFRIVAAIALIISLVTPLTLEDAPAGMVITLILMHIAVAVISVGFLTGLTQR